MGVTSNAIFGDGSHAEPATPGSYGEAPRGFRLPSATRLGPVRLAIGDLERSLDFYQRVLGLRVVDRDASGAVLAAFGDDAPLVELQEQRRARFSPRPRSIRRSCVGRGASARMSVRYGATKARASSLTSLGYGFRVGAGARNCTCMRPIYRAEPRKVHHSL